MRNKKYKTELGVNKNTITQLETKVKYKQCAIQNQQRGKKRNKWKCKRRPEKKIESGKIL